MPKSTAPDFDDVLAGIDQQGGTPLKIAGIIDLLPDDQRPKVETALRNPAISGARIAKALTKMGHPCGEGAVRTWRARHGIG